MVCNRAIAPLCGASQSHAFQACRLVHATLASDENGASKLPQSKEGSLIEIPAREMIRRGQLQVRQKLIHLTEPWSIFPGINLRDSEFMQ